MGENAHIPHKYLFFHYPFPAERLYALRHCRLLTGGYYEKISHSCGYAE